MRKRIWMFPPIVALALVAAWPGNFCSAQETPKPAAETKSMAEMKPQDVYRLEFVVRELEGNKQINSRAYSLSASDHDWGRFRVGSRIPIQVGAENSFQYQDVGINIDCRVDGHENDVLLNAKFDISSVANPDELQGKTAHPVLRSVALSEQSLVTPGKPTVIGKLDDVATTHRFEIEVTATKMK